MKLAGSGIVGHQVNEVIGLSVPVPELVIVGQANVPSDRYQILDVKVVVAHGVIEFLVKAEARLS